MKKNSISNYYKLSKKDIEKYPNIYNLLLELSEEEIKNYISDVKNVELPEDLKGWIVQYDNLGIRNPFIWKWLWRVFEIVKMPESEKNDRFSKLVTLKVALTMFIVLIDDIAENSKDKELLERLVKIPNKEKVDFENISPKKSNYIKKVNELWDYLMESIKEFPHFSVYEDLFQHDFMQTINSINYSYLANDNYQLINLQECWHFLPYNMNVFAYFDLDLMLSENNYQPVLRDLRMVLYKIQKMARIGNWLSTWEREVYEDDYVNAIIAKALDKKVVSLNDLEEGRHELIIKKIQESKIEKNLLIEWEFLYKELEDKLKSEKDMNSFKKMSNIPKEVLKMHLSSKGYK